VLCDPTLKGDLLVRWRSQWKQWGSKFKYWNGESVMRTKYGFGQWGYVQTNKEFPKDTPGIHVMGWQWNEIWGTPSMWDEINKNKNLEMWKFYMFKDWQVALMINWRQVMCSYFFMLRTNHWKNSSWENKLKWQPYTNE